MVGQGQRNLRGRRLQVAVARGLVLDVLHASRRGLALARGIDVAQVPVLRGVLGGVGAREAAHENVAGNGRVCAGAAVVRVVVCIRIIL